MILGRIEIINAMVAGDIKISGAPKPPKTVESQWPKGWSDWIEQYVQDASIDLPIGEDMVAITMNRNVQLGQSLFYPQDKPRILDPAEENARELFQQYRFPDGENPRVLLGPHGRLLVPTRDVIQLSPEYAGQIGTRSSAKRWGIDCGTANWIAPGYQGRITLELKNENPDYGIFIYKDMAYAQLVFHEVEGAGEYHGYYATGDQSWNPKRMIPKVLLPTP